MAIQIDGDTGVSGVNGSATTPALQGTDSNTGIVFGTDEVQVATSGSTRATVDSSGNLLLTGGSDVRIELGTNGSAGTNDRNHVRGDGDNLKYNCNAGGGHIFEANGGERIRIHTNGSVGIDTNNPSAKLEIGGVPNSGSTNELFTVDRSDGTQLYSINYNQTTNTVEFQGNTKFFAFQNKASNGESMRISTAGAVTVGTDNNSPAFNNVVGIAMDGANGVLSSCRNTNVTASFGRKGNDGGIVEFYQAGSVEGSISVSGSTVSYNGGHISRWSQLAGNAERAEILRGSVLSNLDEMCEWAYEAQDAVLYTEEDELPEGASVGDVKTPAVAAGTEDNEQLNRMKVSDVEGDVNVAGVFQGWDDDDDTYTNDFYCAMTGDFVIRIAQGTTVARGDLLMSAGDGTAKPQDDDIVRSKTIAKVTSTTVSTTYSDGSYCVPCVLMAC